MKQRKLNYIIHDPNSEEDTINTLLEAFVQVNERKMERKFQELADGEEEMNIRNGKQREVAEID